MSDLVWVEQAPRAGWRQPVTPATIGREGCDIMVPDPQMSRRHAAVRALDSGVAIEDLGSKNGTFVNDRRIAGITELKEGDRVRFGKTVWKLQVAQRELAEPPGQASGAG